MVAVVKENQLSLKNLVCLDYPDIVATWVLTLEYGQFGEAKEEITKATGAKTYNVKLTGDIFDMKAVLNDEGTKMTMWGITNAMEVWEWITPQKAKEIAEDRDDAEAPR